MDYLSKVAINIANDRDSVWQIVLFIGKSYKKNNFSFGENTFETQMKRRLFW